MAGTEEAEGTPAPAEHEAEAGGEEGGTADDLTMGLMHLLQPVVGAIDASVQATQASQDTLRERIEELQQELGKFQGQSELNLELDAYIAKLSNSRQRVSSVNSLLHSVQDRVNRLHLNVSKAAKRLQDQRAKQAAS